jgi:hypothetical protein
MSDVLTLSRCVDVHLRASYELGGQQLVANVYSSVALCLCSCLKTFSIFLLLVLPEIKILYSAV